MRKKPDPLAPDPVPGGLKHTPLAVLRGLEAYASPAALPQATPPAAPAGSGATAHERVSVRRERAGRGGKCVTLAEGPGLSGCDLAELAREAARALGVGARIESGALVVQGDQSVRLVAWLTARGFGSVVRGN